MSGERLAGISSMATKHLLADLAQVYEATHGSAVAIESGAGVEVARRVEAGEAFDFVVLAADAIDRLVAAGRLAPPRIDVARSGVAVAVAKGAKAPDISSENALREAVSKARSIGFSTGPSGAHLARLFERWGLAGAVKDRLVQAPPGVPVGALIEVGDVELGFQQLSELVHVPGIDILGPLPEAVQVLTMFSGAAGSASRRAEPARAFLAFAASGAAAAARKLNGMQAPAG